MSRLKFETRENRNIAEIWVYLKGLSEEVSKIKKELGRLTNDILPK